MSKAIIHRRLRTHWTWHKMENGVEKQVFKNLLGYRSVNCCITLQRKSHLCIPFLGIALPQSQFPHSCVCERFLYSQNRSTFGYSKIDTSFLAICKSLTDIWMLNSFISGNTYMGTRHWILTGPSFAVYTEILSSRTDIRYVVNCKLERMY